MHFFKSTSGPLNKSKVFVFLSPVIVVVIVVVVV